MQACSSNPPSEPEPDAAAPAGSADAPVFAHEAAARRGAVSSAEAAPMALDQSIETRWDYLAQKYDTDGDGRIVYAEYARTEAAFERLDRNGDGALSAEDFARRQRLSMEERMRDMRTQRTLARHFQTAEDTAVLERAEVVAALAAYDTNSDNVIDLEEFTCGIVEYDQEVPGSPRMIERVMGDVEPWDAFREGTDGDGDGQVTREEVLAFFDAHDRDGVITFRSGQGGRGRRGQRGGEQRESGPAEGTLAPDFSLSPPEGGETITLSDFRGDRPVALIFGSYT